MEIPHILMHTIPQTKAESDVLAVSGKAVQRRVEGLTDVKTTLEPSQTLPEIRGFKPIINLYEVAIASDVPRLTHLHCGHSSDFVARLLGLPRPMVT